MAQGAKPVRQSAGRTQALKESLEEARLSAVITIGAKVQVTFQGPWTGREIQIAMQALPREYYQYQQRRLREAPARAASPAPLLEESHA